MGRSLWGKGRLGIPQLSGAYASLYGRKTLSNGNADYMKQQKVDEAVIADTAAFIFKK